MQSNEEPGQPKKKKKKWWQLYEVLKGELRFAQGLGREHSTKRDNAYNAMDVGNTIRREA